MKDSNRRAMWAKLSKSKIKSMGLPSKEGKRDYSFAIDNSINRARSRFDYPDNQMARGLKGLLGREYYRQLLDEEIFFSKIPNKLKSQYLGDKQFDRYKKMYPKSLVSR